MEETRGPAEGAPSAESSGAAEGAALAEGASLAPSEHPWPPQCLEGIPRAAAGNLLADDRRLMAATISLAYPRHP